MPLCAFALHGRIGICVRACIFARECARLSLFIRLRSRLASAIFDAVLTAPDRLAHAHDLQNEAEHIFALTDQQIEDMGTTREALLRALATRA